MRDAVVGVCAAMVGNRRFPRSPRWRPVFVSPPPPLPGNPRNRPARTAARRRAPPGAVRRHGPSRRPSRKRRLGDMDMGLQAGRMGLQAGHTGLQPLARRVAASGAPGCSLWRVGLQGPITPPESELGARRQAAPRLGARASISSKKMTHGAASLARSKTSRICRSDSPTW